MIWSNKNNHHEDKIHTNGSTNPSVSGAMTICQTPKNSYKPDIIGYQTMEEDSKKKK